MKQIAFLAWLFMTASACIGQGLPSSPQVPARIAPSADPNWVAVSLEAVLRLASRHPDIAISAADVAAAKADVIAADRAPLPIISASAASIDLQNGLGAGSPLGGKRIDKGVGLDWTIERGDKRRHRTDTADQTLRAFRYEEIETLLQRKLSAASAYWDLRAAQDRVDDSQALLDSALALERLTLQRLGQGDVSEQEAARVLTEAARARSDHETVRAARRLSSLVLAQVVSVTPGEALSSADPWPTVAQILDPAHPGADRLRDMVAARPDVRAARARVEAATAALSLARALRQSDITVGGGFNNYPPDQRASVQFRAQMPLQWNYQYDGEIRRAMADLQRAEEVARRVQLTAEADIAALFLQIGAAGRRLQHFEQDILPRSQSVLDRAELAYARGATGLTELLEARRTHRSVRLDAIQARLDFARSLSEQALRADAASAP